MALVVALRDSVLSGAFPVQRFWMEEPDPAREWSQGHLHYVGGSLLCGWGQSWVGIPNPPGWRSAVAPGGRGCPQPGLQPVVPAGGEHGRGVPLPHRRPGVPRPGEVLDVL